MFIGPGRCISREEDFFGAFDLLAVHPERGQRNIQVVKVSGSHVAARRRKIEAIADRFPASFSLEVWRFRGGPRRRGDRLPRGFIRERLAGAGEWVPAEWSQP